MEPSVTTLRSLFSAHFLRHCWLNSTAFLQMRNFFEMKIIIFRKRFKFTTVAFTARWCAAAQRLPLLSNTPKNKNYYIPDKKNGSSFRQAEGSPLYSSPRDSCWCDLLSGLLCNRSVCPCTCRNARSCRCDLFSRYQKFPIWSSTVLERFLPCEIKKTTFLNIYKVLFHTKESKILFFRFFLT